MSHDRPKPGRKASRLSEGRIARCLDYTLEYVDKQPAAVILQGPRSAIRPRLPLARFAQAQPTNHLYAGDNLGILRVLCDDPAVCGKVTLIYIDPPFATGSRFQSRAAQPAYEDAATGAVYLEFLRQRLIVLRELLSPKGSIYVHLDGKMAFPVKVLMDEIFGPANFRNWITRQKSNRKNFTRNQYGNIADYLLFYTRGERFAWNRPLETWTEAWMKTEYPCLESATGRRYKKVPVHAPGIRNGATGQPWRGRLPPPGKHWQYPPAVLDTLDARGEIYWSPTGNPRRKVFFDDSKGVPVQDIWLAFRDAHNQMIEVTGYPTEKNLPLLRRIIAASSHAGDIVLDAFMGSGTTLVAAEEAGRRWIGIDSSLTAIDTTLKRLAQGSEPQGDFVGSSKRPPKKPLTMRRGVLRSNLDLHVGEGIVPRPPSAAALRRWTRLFAP